MQNTPQRHSVRKLAIIGASVATGILAVIGVMADFFQLGSELGWWRLLMLVAIVSVLIALITWMHEVRQRLYHERLEQERLRELHQEQLAKLQQEMEAMKQTRDVQYLRNPAEVLAKAASLLDASRHTLDYYGGLNFINADMARDARANDKLARWGTLLSDRLQDSGFAVTRYIDFIMPSELAALYDGQHISFAQIREQVKEYQTWIETQSRALRAGADGNAFYNLRGAPIWQWGMHVLVFDRRHVMFVFTNTRRNYRGLVLDNDPETATDIHEAFVAWHLNLKRRPITVEQLQAAVQDGMDWLKAHPEDVPVAAIQAPL